ncbi:chromate transporter [Haloplasma contractile]|uniref:Chromate transport protein n=1 Tax=Haloplasma contractile SSD-17B TaxID=1033810 RepID=U2DYX5_9MOLU|nr:chromate transporter [Haloplasma contractile]ERJ13442.1 Chromate transport protein [Haloplasma contractile SSD-17B]
MILLLQLFWLFFKIAAINFGGGFAMIGLIQEDLLSLDWISRSEFSDIVAIAQMTPGAIAINTATFVGFNVASIKGAVIATLAVPLPSLLIIFFISPILKEHNDHPLLKMVFYGILPVVAGLIFSAAFTIGNDALFFEPIDGQVLTYLLAEPLEYINLWSVLITSLSLVGIIKYKLHPIVVIIIACIVGVFVYNYDLNRVISNLIMMNQF